MNSKLCLQSFPYNYILQSSNKQQEIGETKNTFKCMENFAKLIGNISIDFIFKLLYLVEISRKFSHIGSLNIIFSANFHWLHSQNNLKP